MEIIKLENNNGELTATSLEIARVTGKEHNKVLRDIREELGQADFGHSTYLNKQNKSQPMYIISEKGTLQLMSRYSKEVRKMVIDEFYRMKEHIKSQQTNNTLSLEQMTLQVINGLNERVQEVEERNKDLTNVLTTIQTYGDNVLFREFVKIVFDEQKITITEKEFRNLLKKEKFIDEKNYPYARYKKYFNVNKGVKNGTAYTTTRLTAKGQLYFTNKLVKMFD